MADISPFLSTPAQWVEKLAQLRADRQKIEEAEERLRKKLLEYLKANSLETLSAERFCAVISRRESVDFSQKALEEHFGAMWLAAAKEQLPVKVSESLTVKEIKEKPEEDSAKKAIGDTLQNFFGGGK